MGRVVLAAVLRGAAGAAIVVLATASGTILAFMIVFLLGMFAFPVAGLLALASPVAGARLSSRFTGASWGSLGAAATVTYLCGIALCWKMGFFLVQGDAIDLSVLIVGVVAPTFAVSWVVASLSWLQSSRRSYDEAPRKRTVGG
jgi:hypothetical protein